MAEKNDVPYIKPEVKSCRRSGDMHLNGLEMLFSTHRRHRICTFIRRLFLILFSHAVLHSQLVTQCWYRLQYLALFRAGVSKHVVCVPHAAIKGSVWGSQRLKPFCLWVHFMYYFSPRDALQCKARYWDCMSVCLSDCDVGGSGSHRLKIVETNCTDN